MIIVIIGSMIQSVADCIKNIGELAAKFWERYEV